MKLLYFANTRNNPHVKRWFTLDLKNKPEMIFDTTDDAQNTGMQVPVEYLAKGPYGNYPRYIVAGLNFRFNYRKRYENKGYVVHAHSAGGYGLMARLSGLPYMLGIYGTEINSYHQMNPVKRFIMRSVVRNAMRFHVYSNAMQRHLVQWFAVPPEKIIISHLGIDDLFFEPAATDRNSLRAEYGIAPNATVFCVNRRIHPYYETDRVIEYFLAHQKKFSSSHLILVEGHSDKSLMEKVTAQTQNETSITLIRGFIAPSRLRDILHACDFAISMPKTDEVSASVLQGMACGALPIIRKSLDAYEILPENLVNFVDIEELEVLFDKLATTPPETLQIIRQQALAYAKESFSNIAIRQSIDNQFYSA